MSQLSADEVQLRADAELARQLEDEVVKLFLNKSLISTNKLYDFLLMNFSTLISNLISTGTSTNTNTNTRSNSGA
jgi:hypothetical protein